MFAHLNKSKIAQFLTWMSFKLGKVVRGVSAVDDTMIASHPLLLSVLSNSQQIYPAQLMNCRTKQHLQLHIVQTLFSLWTQMLAPCVLLNELQAGDCGRVSYASSPDVWRLVWASRERVGCAGTGGQIRWENLLLKLKEHRLTCLPEPRSLLGPDKMFYVE